MRVGGASTRCSSQSYPQKLWAFCAAGPAQQCSGSFDDALQVYAIIHDAETASKAFSGENHLLSIIQAAGWPIWPLVACSILALALIGERFASLKASKVAPAQLLDEALAVSRTSVPTPDVVTQLEQNSALGEVLASGFRALNANPRCSEADLRNTMEGTGRKVAHELERYLVALATIASAAPLLGLLGTVIGMIEIFGSQAPGGSTSANPAALAHGISVALYNTAFGLIVAIPSLIFWRYFRARVDAYLLTLELASERFVRHLNSLRRP
jgi:biopolymer transport protein ExbB